jgi:magnesium transporter
MNEVSAAIFRDGKVTEHVALEATLPQDGDSAFIWIEVSSPSDRDFAVLQDEVLAMEQRLLDAFLGRDDVTRLFRLRREAIHLQHMLTRMSDVCGKLTNQEVPCIGVEAKPYFRDVHEQLMRLDGMIGGLIDVIRGAFEASNLLEQQRQGASTRKLAGWAAILGAPTAIAAFYGMNFPHVPALHSANGYIIVVGVMLSVCLGLYVRFKKLRWL